MIFKQIFKLERGLVFILTEPKSNVMLSTLGKEGGCVRVLGQGPGLTEFKRLLKLCAKWKAADTKSINKYLHTWLYTILEQSIYSDIKQINTGIPQKYCGSGSRPPG